MTGRMEVDHWAKQAEKKRRIKKKMKRPRE